MSKSRKKAVGPEPIPGEAERLREQLAADLYGYARPALGIYTSRLSPEWAQLSMMARAVWNVVAHRAQTLGAAV